MSTSRVINLGSGIEVRIAAYDPNGPTLLTVSVNHGDDAIAGSATVNIVNGEVVLEPWHPFEHTDP